MKCHILFSEKNKKNISKCRLLKILPRVLSVNSFPTSSNFCYLLIIFVNSLDPDQTRQNVGPDLDPNYLTLWWYSWKIFFEKVNLKKKKKIHRQQKYAKSLKPFFSFIIITFVLEIQTDNTCESPARQTIQKPSQIFSCLKIKSKFRMSFTTIFNGTSGVKVLSFRLTNSIQLNTL